MGGRLAGYENSGKVFLWRNVSSVWGRGYPTLQELDSSPFLPRTNSRRNSKFSRYRQQFNDWFFGRLFRDWFRPSRKEI